MKRRVLFISSCVRGGGAGWSLYYLLKHLDRSKIDAHVLVPSEGIFAEHFGDLGVVVWTMPSLTERTTHQRFRLKNGVTNLLSQVWNAMSTVASIPKVWRLIRRESIELVYCNNMLVKTPGALAAQAAGVPCVLHVRNLHGRFLKRSLYGNLARLAAVRRVIANSAAAAEPYARYVREKVVVVHNGIDTGDFHPGVVPVGHFRKELGIDPETCLVGYTGHLIRRKGVEPLIHAAQRIASRRENVIFAVVGRVPVGDPAGFEIHCRGLVRELGLEDRFLFAGFRDDIRPAVQDFDILVLPSYQEPFGRSIIEAMALGTPVVASRVGGIPEIITDGVNGLLVPSGQVESLAEAIASLVADAAFRRRLSDNALVCIRERFDVECLNQDIQEIILKAVG